MFQSAIPVLHVARSADAETFYASLGFTVEFRTRADDALLDPCYVGVVKDGVRLHLSSFPGDGVSGSAVFILVDDVDALHQTFLRGRVPIAMPPTDQTWGNREMYVRDPDGNALRFVRAGGG